MTSAEVRDLEHVGVKTRSNTNQIVWSAIRPGRIFNATKKYPEKE